MSSQDIFCGLLLDATIPDPQKYHPVAFFGRWAQFLEKKLYKKSRLQGALFLGCAVIPPVALSWYARKIPGIGAISLWASLGAHLLHSVGKNAAQALEENDEQQARMWIPWLCSRDPDSLDTEGMTRAVIESIAENTCDAAMAPLFWASIAGAPGVVAHRCVNTLDAMVGYKNERYQEFGWASARLDDAMAFIPARINALMNIVLAKNPRQAIQAWRTQAPAHPSPNAGPVEATAAAALDIQLGGPTQYAHGVENRPYLGYGAAPEVSDIFRSIELSRHSIFLGGIGLVVAKNVLRFSYSLFQND